MTNVITLFVIMICITIFSAYVTILFLRVFINPYLRKKSKEEIEELKKKGFKIYSTDGNQVLAIKKGVLI